MAFELPELPYDYEALAPFMSKETLEFHHDKHHKAYVDNGNKLAAEAGLADLSLEEVAAYVKISPCYFSFTFKQEEGINFIDYLTMIRIEKAKTFLTASAYKSYEVSYLVGYNNPTYFSTIFKKCVGLSPSAYRTRYLQKPADG